MTHLRMLMLGGALAAAMLAATLAAAAAPARATETWSADDPCAVALGDGAAGAVVCTSPAVPPVGKPPLPLPAAPVGSLVLQGG